MIRSLYALVGMLAHAPLSLWLQRRVARGKESPTRLGERYGRSSVPRPSGTLIWVHAASVGETQSVLPLLRSLHDTYPHAHILLTTGTLTSAALAASQQSQLPRLLHQFAPLDTPFAVKRFLQHWHPSIAMWVESELWPELIFQTEARHIPMLLVNARLSPRSFAKWRKLKRLARAMYAAFDVIFAGSEEDAGRIRLLADVEKSTLDVRTVGNLKYDAEPLVSDATTVANLRDAIGSRPCWLAASTHAGEERLVQHVHQQLKAQFPDLLTLLVPRHAVRGEAIASELRSNLSIVAQRSVGEPITPHTDIYLADTMGELGCFFDVCEIVFIGGSLVAHGGHNVLEPARQHCAILTGAYSFNFTPVIEQLKDAEAIRITPDVASLAREVAQLLTNPAQRHGLAKRAHEVVVNARGAKSAILDCIGEWLH